MRSSSGSAASWGRAEGRYLRRCGIPGPNPPLLSAARLQELLGLEDDELLAVLDAGPLEVVSGDLDHRPELPILTMLLRPTGRPPGKLAERLMNLLKAERDALLSPSIAASDDRP